MSKKILLIDANSIGWAHYYANKLSYRGEETQTLFGLINTLRNYKLHLREFEPFVLWDSMASWRYKIYDGYKSNRKSDDPQKQEQRKSFSGQTLNAECAFSLLGVKQLRIIGYEADDIAGYITKTYRERKKDHQIMLVTGDKDWLQLLGDNVSWTDHRTNEIVTIDSFLDKTGYKTPLEFLHGKALQGDNSDCIPGVPKIGEKRAAEIVAKYGIFPDMLEKIREAEKVPAYEKSILEKESIEIINRNLGLMNLIDVEPPKNKDDILYKRGLLSEYGFKNFCGDYGFVSILGNLDTYLEPFRDKE